MLLVLLTKGKMLCMLKRTKEAFMRLICLVLAVLFILTSVCFAEYVNGHYRKDGTYVNGYNRSNSDSTVRNNYDYSGNTNPYTGKRGSNHYRNNQSSEYFGTSQYNNDE